MLRLRPARCFSTAIDLNVRDIFIFPSSFFLLYLGQQASNLQDYKPPTDPSLVRACLWSHFRKFRLERPRRVLTIP